jgi:predicted aspartyl protease
LLKKYPYRERRSELFGRVDRPLIKVKIFSQTKNLWIPVYDTLADTGADISIIPRYLGEMIVNDITTGKRVEIKGIVPNSRLIAYIHELEIEVVGIKTKLPIAISDSSETNAILGRVKGLNLFNIEFQKGKSVFFKD